TWVAHDPQTLIARMDARTDEEELTLQPLSAAPSDHEALRRWALEQAQCLFDAQKHTGLFTAFGRDECRFFLGGKVDVDRFDELERLIGDEQRKRTEPRNVANLA